MKYITHTSYQEYRDIQESTNKAKINSVWTQPSHIEAIYNYCQQNKVQVSKIICHGTRNGTELRYFKDKFKDVHILGTDISETATNFPDTIQWDFHERKEEWVGMYDIIFSNSWDHAYDFDKVLNTWMESLSIDGRLFLDWNEATSKPFNKADCCGSSKEELEQDISKNYLVEDTFKISNKHGLKAYMIVVKHRN